MLTDCSVLRNPTILPDIIYSMNRFLYNVKCKNQKKGKFKIKTNIKSVVFCWIENVINKKMLDFVVILLT